MKVVVTGGAGYIGSHVVSRLLRQGHEPVTLDNLSKGHEAAILGGKFVKGDIADKQLLTRLFSEEKIDAVIHMAAHSLVGESVTSPSKYFNNNVSNGFTLLDAMVESGVKIIVFSSTAAVYGEPEITPIDEEHPAKPTNPYGLTKLMIEQALSVYEKAYGLKYVSLRYFNAAGADSSARIGEDHSPETHLIPIVLQAAMGKRERVDMFGNDYPTPDGTCVRDYIHVEDLADAHILALEALAGGMDSKIFNLGNGKGFSNREVIRTAEKVTGLPIKSIDVPRRAGDPAVLVASSERIKAELGWKTSYPDLESIILSAWNWHKTHPEGF